MSRLDDTWIRVGQFPIYVECEITDLPPEAQVMVDMIDDLLFDHILLVSAFAYVLVSQKCQDSRKYHLETVPCGCFLWYRESPVSAWTPI